MHVNANPAAPALNQEQPFGQVPLSQLPPGYKGTSQDANSNSPLHAPTSALQNHALQNVNNYSESGGSSPAFNQPGVVPQPYAGFQSSPIKTPVAIGPAKSSVPSNVSSTSGSPSPFNANPSPTPYSQNVQPPQHQINDNAPPLVSSSQFNQPVVNDPPNPNMYQGAMKSNQFPATSTPFSSPQLNKPSGSLSVGSDPPLTQAFGPPVSKPTGPMTSQSNIPFSAPLAYPPRNSPLMQGPPINGPHGLTRPLGPSGPMNGPSPPVSSAFGPPKSFASGLPPASKPGPYINGPTMSGPPMAGPPMSGQPISGPISTPGQLISRQPMAGPLTIPPMTVPPMNGPPISGPPSVPPMSGPPINRPQMPRPSIQPFPGPPRNGLMGPQSLPAPYQSGPQSLPAQFPPRPLQPQPLISHQMGPPGVQGPPSGPSQPPTVPLNGPPKTNMLNRYPQMQPGGFNQPQIQPGYNQPQIPSQPHMPPQPTGQYPQQYNTQNMTQQMGNLSVTKQGFDQLWGHQTVDLMQCKHILPEYPEEFPEIKLGPAFPDAVNCSPE